MSLWHKPVDQVSFADVEAFCRQAPAPREGLRLDFKEAIPGHLERTLSAFGNTLGGMILLGVRGNAANEPEWPPPGMPDSPGISERLVQIARDAVYPSLRIEYSPNLPNPHAPGTVIVVVRVHESPEAPHAVDQGRRIYERTDNVNDPIRQAHVDRIAQLLRRRERLEEQREGLVKAAILRGGRHLWAQGNPVRWASVIPLYPWRDLCTPQRCFELHAGWDFAARHPVQRMPGGSFVQTLQQNLEEGEVQRQIRRVGRCTSLEARGHVFAVEVCSEVVGYRASAREYGEDVHARWVLMEETLGLLGHALRFARRLYEAGEDPGFLSVSAGLIECQGVQMVTRGAAWKGRPFPDPAYRDEMILPPEALRRDLDDTLAPLVERFQYAFDHPPQPWSIETGGFRSA
jgi:hypothetical protein